MGPRCSSKLVGRLRETAIILFKLGSTWSMFNSGCLVNDFWGITENYQ